MEILKYLDVLIALALVMVLLSPMVSALTQLVLWLFDVRATRLEVALETLISDFYDGAFDQFDCARISGVAGGVWIQFEQPGTAPVVKGPDQNGDVYLEENVAAMLQTYHGTLRPALSPIPATVAIGPIVLRPRGTKAWSIISAATGTGGVNGQSVVTYRFEGPAQLAGRSFKATLNPAAGNLSVSIASGPFAGTMLNVAGGFFTYPDEVSPLPDPHDLRLTVTDNNGAALNDCVVTLNFPENRRFDLTDPLTQGVEAKQMARDVLLHPMIARSPFLKKLPWRWRQRAEVVEREEFIRILLGFGSTKPNLRAILAQSGIPDPERAMSDIRHVAQRLEKDRPAEAAHQRLTQAVLEGARSSFVGRINNWFDQVMERTTSEYKFRAQTVTVVAALAVALLVQMDSVDLLRRLSADDKLRDSLVKQAQEQQGRLVDQSKKTRDDQSEDELQLAKSRRDEIEANLAKLRDPQLAVLPDHFVWQRLPQARLMRNPDWVRPFSQRMELVVGPSAYMIEPHWTSDPLLDIEGALKDSGAPLTFAWEKRKQYKVTNPEGGVPDIDSLQIRLGTRERFQNGLGHIPGFATATLKSELIPGKYSLLVGHNRYPIDVPASNPEAGFATAVQTAHAPLSVEVGRTLKATDAKTRWIELRVAEGDPRTNVLNDTVFTGGTAYFDDALFPKAGVCHAVADREIEIKPCTAQKAEEALKNYGFKVEHQTTDYLLITSRRLGPLQLRSVPGKAESNMLNKAQEWSADRFDWSLVKESWLGITLTWILLSLGAPFWYDALKDLLKLRSSLAKKEQKAREDRQSTNTPAAPAPAKVTPAV